MTWLIVVLAIVAVVAIGIVVVEKRRSALLRDRFGPEYERALDRHGDRRAAESDLRARLKRRREVDLRDLTVESRERYTGRWRLVQAAFVDDPRGSVHEAGALVEQVMAERGYLVTDAGADQDGDGVVDRYELVAVDHPTLVERLRSVRSAGDDVDGQGTLGTESGSVDELRETFLRLRDLFEAMTEADADAETDAGTGQADDVEELRS
jgi:hypothetical protein